MSDRALRDSRSMLAWVEQMERQAEQTLAKYEELQAQFGSTGVEVYSEDGLIRVLLDAEGRIEAVDLHEYALRYGHVLGEQIRLTVAQARPLELPASSSASYQGVRKEKPHNCAKADYHRIAFHDGSTLGLVA